MKIRIFVAYMIDVLCTFSYKKGGGKTCPLFYFSLALEAEIQFLSRPLLNRYFNGLVRA